MKLRRCPACRLVGREGRNVSTWTWTMPRLMCKAGCADCEMHGPARLTEDDAAHAWNDLSRAAKRGAWVEDAPHA